MFHICLFSRLTAGSFFPLGRGGFHLAVGDSAWPRGIPLSRGGLFKFGNFENRKGAAKPRPLCTPLGLFLVVQGIRCSYLLTCVCMLRYSAHYAVPILFYFFTFSVIHLWQGVCMLRYSTHYAVPILFHFFTFSVIHFWQGPCILRYSARYALRSLALNLR